MVKELLEEEPEDRVGDILSKKYVSANEYLEENLSDSVLETLENPIQSYALAAGIVGTAAAEYDLITSGVEDSSAIAFVGLLGMFMTASTAMVTPYIDQKIDELENCYISEELEKYDSLPSRNSY